MPIAADIGYGHGPEHPSQGEAHDMTFGCFKASPRYHLQRFAPSCTGLLRRTAPLCTRSSMIACCPSSPMCPSGHNPLLVTVSHNRAFGHRNVCFRQQMAEPVAA